MQLKEGSELQNGKYRIIRVLGQGGFGITYLAENIYFEKMVAIKEFFPKDFCGRDNTSHLTLGTQNNAETVEKLKARFLKEARNIAKLDHPGIIKIHDIFEENNTAYYVMDYIEGENLNVMMKYDGPMSEKKAVGYITKVGEALEYIHSRQMTHFDVKPANIMVRRADNMPILIDFGLSKQYDAQGDATSTLMQGVSHGYSPIELYNAEAITSFSPQTDVYSLAATLLYLLTGSTPHTASQLIEEGLNLPAGISPSIAKAIEEGMAFSRTKRLPSVSAFLSLLKGIPNPSVSTYQETKSPAPPYSEETRIITDNTRTSTENYSSDYNYSNSKPTKNKEDNSFLYAIIGGLIAIIVIFIIIQSTGHSNSEDSPYAVDSDTVVAYEVVDDTVWVLPTSDSTADVEYTPYD
ncbi:MAG: serine/threonine protein kinase [Bacteroides sp.]|nr:serine/threonine protein kinase [Bacteroides sp.]